MKFTCDRCHGDYEADPASAVAHVYIKDRRCNHLEARCSHCGTTEVIFLGPHRIEEAIQVADVPPVVHAEADGTLRIRAERAWQAVETPPQEKAPAVSSGSAPSAPTIPLPRHELTARHERLISSFAETLEKIPDDLLWDGFEEGHEATHPERWVD